MRPVFLNLFKISLPVTALVSILHRLTGLLMFLGLPFIFIWFYLVVYSHMTFEKLELLSDYWWIKSFYWLLLTVFMYHIVAGIRHLIFDFGSSHSLSFSRKTAFAVLVITVLLSALIFLRIFLDFNLL